MRNIIRILLICLIAPAPVVSAEENPITTNSRFVYRGATAIVLAAATKVPEQDYAFKPTEGVRTFGQILGHIADSQYTFCSAVRGEKNPTLKIEKTKTTKADLIASLKDAFGYCDTAYEGLTDASAAQMVKMHGQDAPKLGELNVNTIHTIEHYGNLVTYMRMRNLVPPTSDPEFMKQLSK